MDKNQEKRLTIDLRTDCDFEQYPLPMRFKGFVMACYVVFGMLVFIGIYGMAKFAITKEATEKVLAQEVLSMSQIRAMETELAKIELQIRKANELIEWQSDNIHGQKLLYTLLSGLSKEVLLEKFSFKRDRHNHQATIFIDLKGGHQELNREFEPIPSKLEILDLALLTLNQSAISGGMSLKCICQMNFVKNNKL